ncbi:MAG: hypothetical protein Q9165_007612 [Trypethelium subeluteriae]
MSDPSIRKKPSWVEPAQNQTLYNPSHPSRTKQTVSITYSKKGTQAPVYIATSLSSPPWEPVEMAYESNGEDLEFSKSFRDVEEGTHQYKFRLGPGNWWVLDENASTVHDDNGNENNVLVVRAGIPTGNHLPHSDTNESAEPRNRMDSAVTKEISEIPAVVIDKVNAEPVHGDDLGPDASEGQKTAHERRAVDAQPDEVKVHPTASEDRNHEASSSLGEPEERNPAASREGNNDNIAEHVGFAASGDGIEDVREYGQTMYEDAPPLFAHERMSESFSENEFDPLDPTTDSPENRAWTSQDPESAGAVASQSHTHVESPNEGPPLFTHECASSQEDLPEQHLKPGIIRTPPRRPSTLKNVELASGDEDNEERSRDPSVERFPDTREDIMMHLQQTESRLGHDDSDRVEGTPPSPLMSSRTGSPMRSRSASNNSHHATSPLNGIVEDPIAEDDEVEKGSSEGKENLTSNGAPTKENSRASALAPISSSFHEEIAVHKKPADRGPLNLNTTMPAVLSPPTPPMTPQETLKASQHAFNASSRPDQDHKNVEIPENLADRPGLMTNTPTANRDTVFDDTIAPTPLINGALRQRRPDSDGNIDEDNDAESDRKASSSDSKGRPVSRSSHSPLLPKKNQENMLRILWHTLFESWLNPLSHWIASLCGGRRNMAGFMAIGLCAALVTGFYMRTSDIRTSLGQAKWN